MKASGEKEEDMAKEHSLRWSIKKTMSLRYWLILNRKSLLKMLINQLIKKA